LGQVIINANDPLHTILCGCTVEYKCPCLRHDNHRNDGEKCDVYALGGILFHLIALDAPWRQEWEAHCAKIKKKTNPPPHAGDEKNKKELDVERNRFLFEEIVLKQQSPGLDMNVINGHPSELITLMKDCLKFHPNDRPTVPLLKQRLINIISN
jgi:hypothetical protein